VEKTVLMLLKQLEAWKHGFEKIIDALMKSTMELWKPTCLVVDDADVRIL